jgi:CDP-diacylglycerol--glycerol-3-phosphate 3-phosphatidyltransferase/cardiolipin synthase
MLTVIRLPLAVAFILVPSALWRAIIVVVASASDLLDGFLARHVGSSRIGLVLDPVADKLFMAAAFGVVAVSGALAWYEIVGVLLRDIVATVMFVKTLIGHHATAIPARWSGKAVTGAQVFTLFAFLGESALLKPLAWLTALIALYAIWDYYRVAPVKGQRL